MKIVFVRHGESAGNIDIPSFDLALIPLTPKGVAQAKAVADAWSIRPSLIVTSPYLRARMTAEPTIRRFPGVPVQDLDIQEFVYLNPSQWGGSTHAQRRPMVDRYWRRADTNLNNGGGAESFHMLLDRVRSTLNWMSRLPDDSLVYAFSHGQFMQAVRLVVRLQASTDLEIMKAFGDCHDTHSIANGELMPISQDAGILWTENLKLNA